MDLSIVIPAFNEAHKITRDIEAAAHFLKQHHCQGEIIVVDDGSNDNTAEIAKRINISPPIQCQVIRYPIHRGKGFAVRTGIMASQGEIVLFIDSGLCVPYENINRGLQLLKNDICDVAHGSRFLPNSRIIHPQTQTRQLSSWLFRRLIIKISGISYPLTDTQCGLKIYRGDIGRDLYHQAIIDGFMFDVEIILRSQRQGLRIQEFPLKWTSDHDSRLSQMKMPGMIIRELIRIKSKRI
jgi:dolichyl-phosphate beta-glucosyltransferase